MAASKIILKGKNGDVELPASLGIGAGLWKDSPEEQEGVSACAKAAVGANVALFDTAEIYTLGGSERAVGAASRALHGDQRAIIATKHLPLPWHFNAKKALFRSLHGSLERLQVSCIDIYYVHVANTAARPLTAYADAIADAVDEGLVRAVGVSNFSEDQLRTFAERLATRGVPLAAHQIEFSLVRRWAETNGMLKACQELGVQVVAWAPLGDGGRLTSSTLTAITEGKDVQGVTPQVATLVRELGRIAKVQNDATVEAVALAWIIAKGVVPLIGTRRASHALAGSKALSVELAAADIQCLDRVALEDEGKYVSALSGNAIGKFIADKIVVPLVQGPFKAQKRSGCCV